MGEHYDSKQESSYITYVDSENLYGWAMVQPLAYKDIKFEEIHPPTLETSCPGTFRTISEPYSATLRTNSETFLSIIVKTPDGAQTCFFVEADLEFPPEKHHKLKQMPPC